MLYREDIQSDTFLIQPARFTTRLYTASLMLFTIQTVCYIKLSTISVNKNNNKLQLCVYGIYMHSIFWWVWKLALDLFYGKVQIINENLLNGKKIDDCQKPFLLKKAWITKWKLSLWKNANDRQKPILCKNAVYLPLPKPLKSVDDQPILYLRKYTDKQLQHILQKWLTINLNPYENAKNQPKIIMQEKLEK